MKSKEFISEGDVIDARDRFTRKEPNNPLLNKKNRIFSDKSSYEKYISDMIKNIEGFPNSSLNNRSKMYFKPVTDLYHYHVPFTLALMDALENANGDSSFPEDKKAHIAATKMVKDQLMLNFILSLVDKQIEKAKTLDAEIKILPYSYNELVTKTKFKDFIQDLLKTKAFFEQFK